MFNHTTIRQRVAQAFDVADTKEAEKFLDITLSSWKQISDAITRAVVIIFLLAGAFEILVGSSNIKSLTLGPLTFSNTSLLQQFVPALVAYLLYDVFCLIAQWRYHGAVYFAALERFEPKLFKSELPSMVLPIIRGPWSLGPAYTRERAEDLFDVLMRISLLLVGGYLLPLAFEFQAYYTLENKYGGSDILVWVSAVASSFFILAWLLRASVGPDVLGELRDEQADIHPTLPLNSRSSSDDPSPVDGEIHADELTPADQNPAPGMWTYVTIPQRVAEAFDAADTRPAERFLDITLASWKQISDAITRAVAIIFLLAGAFEILIGSSNVKSLTLGPLTFSNTSLLQQFVPALVAYLLYDMSCLIARWRYHGAIYLATLERFEPKLFDSELPSMVLPIIRGPWSLGPAGKGEQARDWVAVFVRIPLLLVGGFLLPLAFEFQAYYALESKYGSGDILVWVSAVASCFFILAWLLRYVIGMGVLFELNDERADIRLPVPLTNGMEDPSQAGGQLDAAELSPAEQEPARSADRERPAKVEPQGGGPTARAGTELDDAHGTATNGPAPAV